MSCPGSGHGACMSLACCLCAAPYLARLVGDDLGNHSVASTLRTNRQSNLLLSKQMSGTMALAAWDGVGIWGTWRRICMLPQLVLACMQGVHGGGAYLDSTTHPVEARSQVGDRCWSKGGAFLLHWVSKHLATSLHPHNIDARRTCCSTTIA